MSGWTRDNLQEFIEEFRKHESVWKVRCKDYHNRDMKDAAYKKLTSVVQKFDANATKDIVLKKINNIRSAFRKELKKVVASQQYGTGTYTPKLWYFRELYFLLDQEEDVGGKSNITESSDVEDDPESEVAVDDEIVTTPSLYLEQNTEFKKHISSTSTPRDKTSFKRNRTISPSDQVLLSVGQRVLLNAAAKQEDHFDVFGKSVAQKLRLLQNDQRIYAQKVINDALFEAELGGLTRFASINPGVASSRPVTPS